MKQSHTELSLGHPDWVDLSISILLHVNLPLAMPFDGEMRMRNIIKHMYMYSLVPRPFLPQVFDCAIKNWREEQPGNEAIHVKTKSPMMQ